MQIRIPLENIYIMHWSVNPTNLKTLDWHRNNSFDKLPLGRIGTGNEPEFGAWTRLVDDEDDEYNPISNTARPLNPQYPKVFLDDGTHRAKVALEKGLPYLDVEIQ